MLRELQHRYCMDILRDAAAVAEHAGRRPPAGATLELDDLRLATELKRRDGAEFAQRPATVALQRWAVGVNRADLPNVPKVLGGGLGGRFGAGNSRQW
jgi:hypothetical protein